MQDSVDVAAFALLLLKSFRPDHLGLKIVELIAFAPYSRMSLRTSSQLKLFKKLYRPSLTEISGRQWPELLIWVCHCYKTSCGSHTASAWYPCSSRYFFRDLLFRIWKAKVPFETRCRFLSLFGMIVNSSQSNQIGSHVMLRIDLALLPTCELSTLTSILMLMAALLRGVARNCKANTASLLALRASSTYQAFERLCAP